MPTRKEATNLQGVGSNAGPSGKTLLATNLGGQAGSNSTTQTITNCPKCGWPVVMPGPIHFCDREPLFFYSGDNPLYPFKLIEQKGE